jgi:DNA helicase-2/ATP-dependent DNA helicase PcrA
VRFIADIHLHSHYSRSTSKNLDLESVYQWARIKGINVVGTGDFTHPEWIRELEEKLEPAGNGLFRLKVPPKEPGLPNIRTRETDVQFCLSTEISSIYKYGEKVRKNHNLVLAPDFETAKKINARLSAIGNLAADGRPILGLPSRDLLEIVLETPADAHLIPAHVWTPWFSTLGSKGGYDSIEECFRDLSGYIFALETGLSSDPDMNWRLSALDRYSLVSNSDAHSPRNLGREANIFDTELSYYAMIEALKTKKGFLGTYEFFPEEGKYHLDGHRKCNVVLEPRESLERNNLCPRCGKPLTIGVLHRVEKLADRESPLKPEDSPGFEYIIPLPEIIAEFKGAGPAANIVQHAFTQIISTFGSEFELLHAVPLEEIRSKSGELLAEAIRRLRNHEVKPQAGYDGEYGVIRVFNPGETSRISGQADLFGEGLTEGMERRSTESRLLDFVPTVEEAESPLAEPNEEQRRAVEQDGNVLVCAGPGTGKTATLIRWIIHQINRHGTRPHEIMAITFTNKAADELRDRLKKQIGVRANGVLVGTFHAVAYRFLKELEPETAAIYDRNNRLSLFKILFPGLDRAVILNLSRAYEKNHEENRSQDQEEFREYFRAYNEHLAENHAVDLSGIIRKANELLERAPGKIASRFKCIAVDEFQDINPVQYEFVGILSKTGQAAPGPRIFAIGDPNQSVYGFRGSDIRLFYQAKEDLDASEIHLKKNYRTPENILAASNRLILQNRQRGKADLEAVKSPDVPVKHHVAEDSRQEAAYIADQILNYVGGVDTMSTGSARSDYSYAFSDIAVLYRTHRIADDISQELKRKGIPVLLSDGTSFFSEPPFDVIACAVQLLQNERNLVALSGLSERFLELNNLEKQFLLKKYMDHRSGFENFSGDEKWEKWIMLYKQLRSGNSEAGIQDTVRQLLDFFLPGSALSDLEQIKREMILRLADVSGENTNDFLQQFILSPYTDAGRLDSGGVRLLTFHAAKGLEFPVVIIAGAEEGISPLDRQNADLEEERRLFYVAMTRAKDELQIVRSKKRRHYGQEKEMPPSRFLGELEPERLQKVDFKTRKKSVTEQFQLKLF